MITGVDILISQLRDDFAELWPDVSNQIYYSRAFTNERVIEGDKQIIPEIYNENNQYKEVMFDNKRNVSVFFTVANDRINLKDQPETIISAIFAVNLDVIYPGVAYRQEENVHADVMQIFEVSNTTYNIDSIDLTVGLNAYNPFYKENVKQYNMHPWHTFRFDLAMRYSFDCNDNEYNRGADNTYPDPVII